MVDKSIRGSVKTFLHVPKQLCNAFLYTDFKGGGLGLFSFYARIPDILLGRLERLRTSGGGGIGEVLSSEWATNFEERLHTMVTPFGRGPKQQKNFWRSKLERSFCGAGLAAHSGDSSVSAWIRNPPTFWSGNDFVRALQLRAGVLPTRGGLHNTRLPFAEKRCRGGCARVETVCHVLQRCDATHFTRMRRHNRIVGILKRAATRCGWNVTVEPHTRDALGRPRYPDLVLEKGNGVVVADVAVHWEAPNPLATAFQHKVAKYSDPDFVRALQRIHPDKEINISAMVLGARGTWCAGNDQLFRLLGLPRRVAAWMVSDVMMGSLDIHRDFARVVWDPDP